MSGSDFGFGTPADDADYGSLEYLDIPVIVGVLEDEDSSKNGTGTGGKSTLPSSDANIPANGQLLTLGTNPDGSHFFTGNRNIDATLIGSKWGMTNLTYSFPTSGSNYSGAGYDSNGVSLYHIDLGPQQQAAARAAFAQLAALTGLTFTEITETDTVHANIRISQSADNDVASAYGNFPSDTKGLAGDIWFGRTSQPYYDLAYKGTWGFATIMHEIGHTLGLKHGHQDYTNADLSFYFGTSPRYGTQSLTPDRDGQAYSLMTYTPAPFTNSNFAGDKISQPQTYMQYDIAALQYLYGANFNTNSGDTVYTFSQTTGEVFINGVGQGVPSGNRIFFTIWDGGGNDTIDASNYANGVTIDLRPGEYSTVDQAQLANNLAAQSLTSFAPGNFAMSLLYNNDSRSLIENAKGGAGNDVFVGNTANNILDGGAGSDTVIFTNTTGVNVTLNDIGADVIVNHDGETDTLRSIENIVGTSGNDTIVGNSQDNTLNGGSSGADVLTGNDGNDRLIGGGFTVTSVFNPGTPASQPDITKPQATANTSIATAFNLAGTFDIDANPNITNATTIPHATINATSAAGLEYYRFDVTGAGAQAIFDIDGTGTLTDSIIELVDAAGNVLASNDTGPGDPGTTTGDDGYITYTFAAAGTYYIRVGRYTGTAVAQPLLAGTTYQLHVSVQGAAGATTFVNNNASSLNASGGEGNDYLQGTYGDDILNGGNGNDTASFVTAYNGGGASTTGVTVDLNVQGVAQNTVGAGNDTLTGIENLIGSQYNDTLTGDGGNNVIEGGLGNDTLVGGLGSDTASYAGATAGVTVSLGLQGAAQNTVNAGSDTLSGFENLLGSAFNDNLTGDGNANTLTGGAGDDILNPGANAGGTVDVLDGGAGSDTVSFAGIAAGVTAQLVNGGTGNATIAGAAIASFVGIENLIGGSGADFLFGNFGDNSIEGGLGDDYLDGLAGVDTLVFTGTTAVTVNLATTTAQATGWGNDTILNFENVRTGSGADSVTGDGNDNIFFDGGGNDIYNGAGGIDTIDYTNIGTAVTVNLNTVAAQTVSSGNSDTITNIENVIGSLNGINTLTGNAVANTLTGGAAADTIVGNNGNDVIFGGAGADFLLGGTSSALDDGSSDTLYGGAGNDYLSGGQGNDFLYGGDGDDTLNGTVGATTGGFFAVDGGDDTFDGGDGTDIAILAYENRTLASTVGVAFDIGNLAGNSNITINGVVTGSLTSIERVTFRGTAGNDVVKGGGSIDSLTGNAGDDVLDGWYGNDVLDGGLGNDTLIGGEGLDTATYALAPSGVTVDLRLDGIAQNTGGYGIDTLSGIEYLIGSAFGDTLRGNDEFNLIIDSGVGAGATALSQTDSIFGYGGNDSILVTRANTAVATNINLDGGDGDDFIELRSGTLTGFTLAANAAGLSATTSGAAQTYAPLGATSADRNSDVVTVDGGAGNDRIVLTGVASATVNAGSGDDIVSISMRGLTSVNNYTITLGTGADIIQFGVGTSAATSTDVAATARTSRVTDFQVGDAGDKFELTNFLNFGLTGYTANSNPFASGHMRLVQSGTDLLIQTDRDGAGATNSFVTVFAISNGYTGGFTAFNFDGFIGNLTLSGIGSLDETITGATGDDVLSGNDGNDTLVGLAGNDTLDGGNGNDILRGGLGNDTLIGGAGIDTASYSDATGAVTVSLNTAAAQNTGAAGIDTLSGIENLTGSSFDDILTGSALANVLTGGDGNDSLLGLDGDDTLDGGNGDDQLRGGAGNDTLIGGAGIDTASYKDATSAVTVSLAIAGAQVTGGAGTDTLSGIENLNGSAYNDTLTGDAGANRFSGGAGDDYIDGGAGVDDMFGGTGNDTYIVDNTADLITEFAGEGIDTVFASANYFLTANVENLILTGAARKGSGNDLANDITGTSGANVLNGLGGDDVLRGGAGNDTLYGGTGSDRFVFDNGTGQDIVMDFVSGSDKLDFRTLGFTSFAQVQAATTDVGGNAVIDLGGGNSVTLTGFLKAQLQSGDVLITNPGAAVSDSSDARVGIANTDVGHQDQPVADVATVAVVAATVASGTGQPGAVVSAPTQLDIFLLSGHDKVAATFDAVGIQVGIATQDDGGSHLDLSAFGIADAAGAVPGQHEAVYAVLDLGGDSVAISGAFNAERHAGDVGVADVDYTALSAGHTIVLGDVSMAAASPWLEHAL